MGEKGRERGNGMDTMDKREIWLPRRPLTCATSSAQQPGSSAGGNAPDGFETMHLSLEDELLYITGKVNDGSGQSTKSKIEVRSMLILPSLSQNEGSKGGLTGLFRALTLCCRSSATLGLRSMPARPPSG